MNVKMLIVEDNQGDADYIKEILENQSEINIHIHLVSRLQHAIDFLEKENADIILLDLGLPDSRGINTLISLKEFAVNIPIIVLTGNDDQKLGLQSISNGAQDYLVKNQISIFTLIRVVKYTIERQQNIEKLIMSQSNMKLLLDNSSDAIYIIDREYRYITINQAGLRMIGKRMKEVVNKKVTDVFKGIEKTEFFMAYKRVMENRNPEIYVGQFIIDNAKNWYEVRIDPSSEGILCFARNINARKNEEQEMAGTMENLKRSIRTTIDVLTKAVELKDPYTAGHQKRVAMIAREIAIELGLDSERTEGIFLAGSIHDIGKISIPAEILSKPTKLDKNEMMMVKLHTSCGCDLLKEVESDWHLCEIALQHHERINGSGYPNGITGDKMLLESKIIAVADVVEAMSSHRPYRTSLGIEAALHEINEQKGILYDEQVVDACNQVFAKNRIKL
ncbi:MAG: response regulator [Clostridia bacterium]|nr:response regulator [Clostridia bacterium]